MASVAPSRQRLMRESLGAHMIVYTIIIWVLVLSATQQYTGTTGVEPTLDQRAIYGAILRAARAGDFDGCPLKGNAELARKAVAQETDVYLDISEMPKHFEEALDSYKSTVGAMVDVTCLGDSMITVVDKLQWQQQDAKVWLSHIGFDEANNAATAKIVYSASFSCGSRTVLVFLLREIDHWVVTQYWVMENPWGEVKDIYKQ